MFMARLPYRLMLCGLHIMLQTLWTQAQHTRLHSTSLQSNHIEYHRDSYRTADAPLRSTLRHPTAAVPDEFSSEEHDQYLQHAAPKSSEVVGCRHQLEALQIPKVAMLFLSRGALHHEGSWEAWFRLAADLVPLSSLAAAQLTQKQKAELVAACSPSQPDSQALQQQHLLSVYIHLAQNSGPEHDVTPDSLWSGRIISEHVKVEWGTFSLVVATKALLQAALADPLNKRFLLLSESCVPLYPPTVLYHQLLYEEKSRINSCITEFDRGLHRWVDAMTTERMNISHWRKSSQWFSLLREHAEIVIKDTEIAASFAEYCYPTNTEGRYRDCFPDEHYFPTMLSALGRENETDCHGFITNVDWGINPGWDPHPRTYHPDKITVALLGSLRMPSPYCNDSEAIRSAQDQFIRIDKLLEASSSSTQPSQPYSALSQHCPLLARKFGPTTANVIFNLYAECDDEPESRIFCR